MTSTSRFRIAAFNGALAVGLGAFGAHGLSSVLEARQTVNIWETAVFYHFVHALVLLWGADRGKAVMKPWWCFLLGTAVFSGALYALAVSGEKWLGAVAPVGGMALLIGWLWLGLSFSEKRPGAYPDD